MEPTSKGSGGGGKGRRRRRESPQLDFLSTQLIIGTVVQCATVTRRRKLHLHDVVYSHPFHSQTQSLTLCFKDTICHHRFDNNSNKPMTVIFGTTTLLPLISI